MNDLANKITYLDGPRLSRALIAGIREVISRQEHLNNINVFPVPDRDTGTNLALTLNSVIEATYGLGPITIHELLDVAANAALDGSRGNSGAIFAQFFIGLSVGAKFVKKKFTTKNFVMATSTAVNHAHKALSEPKEGTILTVMRDFAESITEYQLSHDEADFINLLSAGIERAEKGLQNTAFQLKECRKAGVVDAGAQGFVDFLNGIYDFIENGSIEELGDLEIEKAITVNQEELEHSIDERFRYCTECLIKSDTIDHNELREKLDSYGNSLIVAGTDQRAKVHIHANDPAAVFDLCRQYGSLTGEKADDMIQQQHSTLKRQQAVAILTDSAADFTEGSVHSLNIHVVPLLINFGTTSYIDKISITPAEFYQELARNKEHPKTSQPSVGDFKRQYEYLISHYESIVAIHVPRKGSGTFNASKTAAKNAAKNGPVSVIDCKSVSAGQGLIVKYAAMAAQAGYNHDEIVAMVNDIIPKTKQLTAVPDLTYAVRGGRVSQSKKTILDLFRLTPILSFSKEGRVSACGVLRGRRNVAEKFVRYIIKQIDSNKQYHLIIEHCNNLKGAEEMQSLLQQSLNNLSCCDIVDASAALGAHAGPGTLGVALQEHVPIAEKNSTTT